MTRMKKLLLIVAITGAVCCLGWYGYTWVTHKRILHHSAERLRLAEVLVGAGRLKPAVNLLALTRADLAQTDRFYTLPTIDRRRAEIAAALDTLDQQARASLALVQQILDDLSQAAPSGKYIVPYTRLEQALSQSGKNVILLAIEKYLARLQAQDFNAAQESLAPLLANLPDAANPAQVIATLQAIVGKEREANLGSQERLAAAVRAVINPSRARASESFRPAIKGRVMVWDFTTNAVDPSFALLPDELRATARDEVVTVLCIIKREQVAMGRAAGGRRAATKERMTVGVAYWPEKTSPGTALVWGGLPRGVRARDHPPGHGSALRIRDWVAALPRN